MERYTYPHHHSGAQYLSSGVVGMDGLNPSICDCLVPQEQERNGDLFRGGKGILLGQGTSFVSCRGVAFKVPGMPCVVQPWTVDGVTMMIKS